MNREKFLYLVDRYNVLYKEYILLIMEFPNFPDTIEFSTDMLNEIDSFILDYAFEWNDNLDTLERMIISVEDYILQFKQEVQV